MVTDRNPPSAPRQLDIEVEALKAEVASLQRGITQLEAELAEARRQQHVDMGRGT